MYPRNRNHLVYSILFPRSSSQNHQLKKLAAILLLARFAKISRLLKLRPVYRHLLRSHLLPDLRHGTDWRQIRCSRDNRAYLITMGVDVAAFEYILQGGFEDLWNTRTIFRADVNEHGRPRLGRRSLPADGALGLVLHWITSTESDAALSRIFAVVPAVLSRYLSYGLQVLCYVLQNLPEGQVVWPAPHEMAQFSEMIQRRHPAIQGAFGFVDGLNLPVETSSDPQIEEATYNGWLHSHRISNIFVFAPNGCVIACKLNAPGSWHDVRVARHIHTKLTESTPDGFFLIADTAFLTTAPGLAEKIRTPLKQGSRLPVDRDERAAVIEYSNRLTQARQAVEWGMRALQSVFSRLRVPMKIGDPEGRQRLLEVCTRLHNLRTRCVGINEIRSVYMPEPESPEMALQQQAYSIFFPRTQPHDRIGRFFLDNE